MKRYKYQALLTLFPPEQGGLAAALPSETRCLVVKAHHPGTHLGNVFSSVITTSDDGPLRPGDAHVRVTMQLNGNDDTSEYFGPGEHFVVWFRTDVGYGVVSRRMFT